tara:strand:- start:187 stop:453 length:267 start_codon:yes stop_codon:yes gene_type:complete
MSGYKRFNGNEVFNDKDRLLILEIIKMMKDFHREDYDTANNLSSLFDGYLYDGLNPTMARFLNISMFEKFNDLMVKIESHSSYRSVVA